jgi:hypothetical protein
MCPMNLHCTPHNHCWVLNRPKTSQNIYSRSPFWILTIAGGLIMLQFFGVPDAPWQSVIWCQACWKGDRRSCLVVGLAGTFIMLRFMGNARHAIDSLHHYMIHTIRSSPKKMSNTCPVFDMGTSPKCLLS